MKIEWASHFNPDGTRRRPPASTMHGWLAKMRGTLVGDEALRSRGMREMREAAANRKRQAIANKQHSAATGKSTFSFFGFRSSAKPRIAHKPNVLHQQQRPPQSRRTTHDSARSGRGGYPNRPPPKPSGNSNRSNNRRRTQDSYVSQSGQRRSSRR